MGKRREIWAGWLIKSLLAAYITSSLMLVMISFLLYKFDLSEQTVEIGIIITYILSAFIGGFFVGKQARVRRFLWGALIGTLYFVFLILVSIGVYRSSFAGMELLISYIVCLAGGMIGGMMS